MGKGFPKMVRDLRGNLSAAKHVLGIWLKYSLFPIIIHDLENK